MLSAMRPALREHDMHLTLFGAEDDDFADPRNPPRLVREHSVDGFLVLYDDKGRALSEQIANYRIPSVWINQKQAKNAVYPDDFSLAARAVRELAARKAGHLLYYGPPKRPGSHYSVIDRRDGFLQGLKDVGRSGEVIEAPLIEKDPAPMHHLIRSILQRKNKRPSIFLTYGMEEAETLLVQSALLGLKIPEELIVCCFSFNKAEVAGYPITRIFVPIHTTGAEAVKMLIQRIASPKKKFPSIALDKFILHEEPGPKSFYEIPE
jgi:DNA-binding LacI/PurR family transcriptional regulator